jgi:transcriptional regulator with XRE-family HTH domain
VKTHNDMIAAWKKNATFRKEYDALEETFALFDALLKARYDAGLTQAEVAERMGTKTSAVARLEAGGGRQKHSPSLATLRKYAAAVGCRVEIKLVPVSQSPRCEQEKPAKDTRRAQPNHGMQPTRNKPRAADA